MSSSSFPSIENSVIERFNVSLNIKGHNLFILRDDLIHPFIAGNKWRKLQYVIEEVRKGKFKGIITYGGAYSNHLVATATACKLYNIPCVLVVRGEELNPKSNPYLMHCEREGAKLNFVSRQDFKKQKLQEGTRNVDGQAWLSIPEGGACALGLKGCMQILEDSTRFDIVALAQGTTTTSLGVLLNCAPTTALWGFPVLKGFDALAEMEQLANRTGFLTEWEEKKKNFYAFNDFHFYGYAKHKNDVQQQIIAMGIQGNFKLDPVYTGKALIGLITKLNEIKTKKNVLFIHTGGVLPIETT